MQEVVVKVEGLSKKFCKSLKRSMLYGIQDIGKNIAGFSPDSTKLRLGEFWALDDVSFALRRGECLGLIGPNGSGKSTLLKLLNGILMPDKGRIEIKGHVGALIELGAGFHPMLTGRENIYINGSILGLSSREIDQKLDNIIEFSELGDFIDSPVKYYSSGMYVRLGFAVAAHLKPDILLIDEVLAVGDAGFRSKCYERIYAMLQNCAVIFVSHNMAHVNRMCNSVLLLDGGTGKNFSKPNIGIKSYYQLSETAKHSEVLHYSNGQVNIKNLQVKGLSGTDNIFTGQPFEVTFELSISSAIKEISIILSTLSREKMPIAYSKTLQGHIVNNGKKQTVRFFSPQLTLTPDRYSLSIAIFDEAVLNQLLWHYNVAPFTVRGEEDYVGVPVKLIGDWII
jgi:lipopolysaccharide transport system ATP-binding protein